MDLKPVMSGLTQPHSRTEIGLPQAANLTQSTAATGDRVALGVAGILKGLFEQTTVQLEAQDTLLQSLPAQIKIPAEQIMQNSLPDLNTLSAGLVPLVNSRRIATNSLMQLAQKLQVMASALSETPDNPQGLFTAVKRYAHQVTSILAQLNLDTNEADPSVLQKAREQIQSVLPDMLQAATKFTEQKPASVGGAALPDIQTADKLNLPELSQIWQSLDTDLDLSKDSIPQQVAEQVSASLKHLVSDSKINDPMALKQAREQIQAALDIPQQAAAGIAKQQTVADNASIPLAIRQAADKLSLPELLQLWPLNEIELVALLDSIQPDALKQHAATVRTLAESVSRAFQTVSDDQGQAVLFSLQMPFNGASSQPKPIHIHIYHEKGQTKNGGSEGKPDTWVRVTLQPEYIGQVNTIFHLYGGDILDIKVVFPNEQASLLFGETVTSIREAFSEFPFKLREVSIGNK